MLFFNWHFQIHYNKNFKWFFHFSVLKLQLTIAYVGDLGLVDGKLSYLPGIFLLVVIQLNESSALDGELKIVGC